MYNQIITVCLLIILVYLSLFSNNDMFQARNNNKNYVDGETGVNGETDIDGETGVDGETNTEKCDSSKGIHINMHHIDGVANLFAPNIKIDI